MKGLLCSTGAFVTRLNGRDFYLIPKMAALLDCDGLEFMMYDTWYDRVEEITEALDGLPIPVMHVEKSIGERISLGDETAFRDFAVNCRMAARIGAERLVMHLWNGRPSDHHISRNIDAYAQLRAIAEAEGRLLTVENVVCAAEDPLTHFKTLRERYPDIAFTFDTKMAAFHHQLDEIYTPEWAWLWRGAVAHWHLNDYGGGYRDWDHLRVLHPGEGWVDLKRVCDRVRASDYTGYATSEATAVLPDGTPDVKKINATLAYYRENLDI